MRSFEKKELYVINIYYVPWSMTISILYNYSLPTDPNVYNL